MVTVKSIVKPYEGNAPCIFVSFSDKDVEKVFSILERLQREGFKFWYNESSEHSEESFDKIAERILCCEGVIAFHSQNSKQSVRCKNEISFSCNNNKLISIYIENVELSLGVQMAVHQFPLINFYEYSEKQREKFYSELLIKLQSLLSIPMPPASAVATVATAPPGFMVAGAGIGGVGDLTLGNSRKSFDVKNSSIVGKFPGIIFGAVKKLAANIISKKTDNSLKLNDKEIDFEKEKKSLIPPYEGNKPYAFISYSRRDSTEVFNILKNFRSAGLRFWYDAGIEYGSEWADCIAEHILDCECLIAFHSKSSGDSPHCKNEISFLNFKGTDKQILSIYLERVSLSIGTQMNISRFQSMNFYEYRYKERFYSELIKSPAVRTCLK